jgi:hypothetical protein
MAAILKSRDKQVPNGFSFYDSATGFKSVGKYPSFNTLVAQVIAARKGNPSVVIAHHLATDPALVADEVDRFNAEVCRGKGWGDFIRERGRNEPAVAPGPFQPVPRPVAGKLASLAAGTAVVIEWLSSGADAVPAEQAESRAAVCAGCPMNDKLDEKKGWEQWFTLPWANGVKRTLNARREMKLETSRDSELGTCKACLCVIQLKVHLKLESFYKDMPQQDKDALHESCWILAEERMARHDK